MKSNIKTSVVKSFAVVAASLFCFSIPSSQADAAVVYYESGTIDCQGHVDGNCLGGFYDFGLPQVTFDPIRPGYVKAGTYAYSFTVENVGDVQFTSTLHRWIWGTVFSPYGITFLEYPTDMPDPSAVYSSTGVSGVFSVGPHFDSTTNGVRTVGDAFAGINIEAVIQDNDPILPTRYEFRITALPEPDTWALVLTGFGLAGAALRRQRAVVRI